MGSLHAAEQDAVLTTFFVTCNKLIGKRPVSIAPQPATRIDVGSHTPQQAAVQDAGNAIGDIFGNPSKGLSTSISATSKSKVQALYCGCKTYLRTGKMCPPVNLLVEPPHKLTCLNELNEYENLLISRITYGSSWCP